MYENAVRQCCVHECRDWPGAGQRGTTHRVLRGGVLVGSESTVGVLDGTANRCRDCSIIRKTNSSFECCHVLCESQTLFPTAPSPCPRALAAVLWLFSGMATMATMATFIRNFKIK